MIYSFRSSDADAPTLAGTAGYLATVLDKILVDGYNVKTITITRTGSVATASCTAHGYRDKMTLLISGADQADYNGEFRITYVDANSFTFTVANSPATPATGTISAKVAPLGWSIAYTGTNIRSYRHKAGTNQYYLGVDDTGAQTARTRGFVSASAAGVAVGSGTNPFPTDTQLSGGVYAYKSNAASTAARWWRAYSNGTYLYLFWDVGSSTRSNGTGLQMLGFGDLTSRASGDIYCTHLLGHIANNDTSVPVAFSQDSNGSYLARAVDQSTQSVAALKFRDTPIAQTRFGSSAIAYPDPITGGISMTRIGLADGTGLGSGIRAYFPGWWNPLHGLSYFSDFDTFSGAVGTPLEGRTFEWVVVQSTNGVACVFETSDTWD